MELWLAPSAFSALFVYCVFSLLFAPHAFICMCVVYLLSLRDSIATFELVPCTHCEYYYFFILKSIERVCSRKKITLKMVGASSMAVHVMPLAFPLLHPPSFSPTYHPLLPHLDSFSLEYFTTCPPNPPCACHRTSKCRII